MQHVPSVRRLRLPHPRACGQHLLSAALLGLTLAPAQALAQIRPAVAAPVAEVRPFDIVAPHGHVRTDPYYWLRDPTDPEVIRYLNAENAYTDAAMGHTAALQERVFQEIRARIRETDISVPYRRGRYWYYTRHEEGKEHPIHARRRGSMDGPEEILLDDNVRAEGRPFYRSSWQVSPGDDILAFAEDTLGRNIVTIRFRNLQNGELLPDVIDGASWNMVWAEDNRTLFYATRHPVTLRTHRIYRHVLGTPQSADELVHEESDETFSTGVSKTRSREFIVIGSYHQRTQEYRYAPADRPTEPFRVFLPRERGHEHSIDHYGGYFYIRTNAGGAANFRLARTPEDRTGREHWEELIAHRGDALLQSFMLFRDHLVVSERSNGLLQIRIRPWSGEAEHYVRFDEDAYVAYPIGTPEPETRTLRFGYESMTTPLTTFDYDMATRERTLLKQTDVLGGYDPAEYRTERLFATVRDGARVPITLVYRRDLRRDGPQPLLLYGYGSYGASTDPGFSSLRLSLLDRGFIYAIAHIRGGQEFGRAWYEAGRLLHKKNTFFDFIDAAEYLVASGYTAPETLFAEGGSAGGLLIGAVINERPDLFHGALAHVPFVDVVTTMLDESIPLTTFEYEEWGDPRDPAYYEYMLSYSPYDNVRPVAYPHLLVTSGLHDSQVQFWEPTKWVARLRSSRTDANRLLLRTNMEAGHGGAAGRYQRWREIAFNYAFLIDLAGLAELQPAGPSGRLRAPKQ
jgi:oligopeptidase B